MTAYSIKAYFNFIFTLMFARIENYFRYKKFGTYSSVHVQEIIFTKVLLKSGQNRQE
jgi:hypothetical protein